MECWSRGNTEVSSPSIFSVTRNTNFQTKKLHGGLKKEAAKRYAMKPNFTQINGTEVQTVQTLFPNEKIPKMSCYIMLKL